jgi:hypothetical protein
MTAPARFRTARAKVAPRWLTEGDGQLVGYSLDLVKDVFVERLRQGLLVRFPQQGPNGELAPSDALVTMGRDRRVVYGLSDTDATYAAKLKLWLDDRRRAGSAYMLMQKLAEYLGPLPSFRTVDARGNWYSRAANGDEEALLAQENWDWSGDAIGERWSRFWVIVYPNGLWTENTFDWGDIDWDDTVETYGSTAPLEHVQTVRAVTADWMPAGTRCVKIIIAFDPASFDPTAPEPDGLWEHSGKTDNGVSVPSRLSTARYWAGVVR